jgi:hypothetical protein
MFLDSFTDELVRCGRPGLIKTARILSPRGDRLIERMTAIGGLSSGAMHGVSKAEAALTANPYDGPQGTFGGALAKGAIGGLLAALGIKALGAFHGRKA